MGNPGEFEIEEVRQELFPQLSSELAHFQEYDRFISVDLLDEPERCRPFVLRRRGRITSYLVTYSHGSQLSRLGGDPGDAAALLDSLPEEKSFLMCPAYMEATVRLRFPNAPMFREHLMAVGRGENRTVNHPDVCRLNGGDAQALFDLYSSGEFADRTANSSVEIYREQMEREPTFGIMVNGRLASLAGVITGDDSFSMVTGVFTARSHRGKGLGTAVTSAATASALEHSARAILYVRHANEHAISSYLKLGYRVREEWDFFDFGTGIVP